MNTGLMGAKSQVLSTVPMGSPLVATDMAQMEGDSPEPSTVLTAGPSVETDTDRMGEESPTMCRWAPMEGQSEAANGTVTTEGQSTRAKSGGPPMAAPSATLPPMDAGARTTPTPETPLATTTAAGSLPLAASAPTEGH